MHVVHREQKGPTRGDIRGQPEEPVEARRRRVSFGLRGEVRWTEKRRRERRRPG
jgi:hypothetical protein